jgi:hypothetical protein
MTQATQRAFLIADKATRENLLSALQDNPILEGTCIEARLCDVIAKLASLDAHNGLNSLAR